MRNRRRILAALVPVVLGAVVALTAAGRGHDATAAKVWKADNKPRKDIKHDKSAPLKTIAPKHGPRRQRTRDEHRFTSKTTATKNDPVVQTAAPTSSAPTAGTSFEGIATADLTDQYVPPDPNAAVGPNAIVEVVNTAFEVFSKAGASIYGPADTNTLWSGFGGDCEDFNDGDATVSYDRIAQRWVMQQFAVSGSAFNECIAVSATSDPTGSWYRYQFGGFGGEFPDYPKLGVWPDAYYVTYNLFPDDFTFDGPEVCAYDRAAMLNGDAADQQCEILGDPTVNGLLPSDFDGSTLPPDGAPNYLLGVRQDPDTLDNSIVMYSMHVDWAHPNNTSLTGPTTLGGVAAFNLGCDLSGCARVPDKGGTKLDTLGDRLMYRLAYRNLGTHEAWVVNHTVMSGNVAGIRWYELRSDSSDTTAPTLFQQGTYAPSDSKWRWMGSAAMDSNGNIALGYSISNGSIYPGIAYTGRLAGDGAGTMTQGETLVRCGSTASGCGGQTTYSRWGDYSSMSVDPADDCTFWYTNEYLPSTGVFNWRTRITSFKLPGCSSTADQFSLSPAPASLTIAQGDSDTSTISSSITNGAAQAVNLTASGMPFDTTVSFTPSSINSGNASTMTVDVGENTPAGTYTLNVRGTGATDVQTTNVSLAVTAPNAVVNGNFEPGDLTGWTQAGPTPTIVPTPKKKAGPASPGHSVQIGMKTPTAGDSTLSQDVTVPTGTTALSFWYRPTCSSTATGDQIQVQLLDGATILQTLVGACTKAKNWVKAAFDTSAYAGQTITLRFDAHGTGVKKKPTYSLLDEVVLTRQVPDVANGGFESGDLTGWQSTGTAEYTPTVVTSPPAHGGTYSVRLGSLTDPGVASNSSVSQAVVVPGINPVLTIWYQPHCTDVPYDFIQVKLKKNPGGQLLKTLLNTCETSSTWKKATFDLSAWAGQSVTLVLNVSSDSSLETDALFDDISITHG